MTTHFDILVEIRGLQLKLVYSSERIFKDIFCINTKQSVGEAVSVSVSKLKNFRLDRYKVSSPRALFYHFVSIIRPWTEEESQNRSRPLYPGLKQDLFLVRETY